MSTYFNLKNKNIVVTGGNGFLGRVFCEAIAENNGNPIILDINSMGSKKFINNLSLKYKVQASFYKCNITIENQVKIVLKKIIKDYSNVHCLINNAAMNPKKMETRSNLLENFTLEMLNNEIKISVIGSFICTKLFGSYFAKKNYGNIINIASDLGIIAPNHSIYNKKNEKKHVKPVSYSIIKSAIIGLTKYTSTYWSTNNVRCNSLAPGGILEDQNHIFIRKISELIPMKRMGKKQELKGAIVFLISEASSYINGHTLVIDGGRSVW